MNASEGHAKVGTLIAAARRELVAAEACRLRGEDCSAALARAVNRRDEAISALLDAGESEVVESNRPTTGISHEVAKKKFS